MFRKHLFYKRGISIILMSIITLCSILGTEPIGSVTTSRAAQIINSTAGTEAYEGLTNEREIETENTEMPSAVTGSAITAKAKGLFITELYFSHSDNGNSFGTTKPMEYVELYNSTDEDIHFDDNYKISCVTGSAIEFQKLTVDGLYGEDIIIPVNTAAILWINGQEYINEEGEAAVKEFRESNHIDTAVPVYSLTGLTDLSTTGGILLEKDGKSLSVARYTEKQVASGKSIHYKVPDSGSTMSVYKLKSIPTPGVVEEEQLICNKEAAADTVPPRLSLVEPVQQIQLGDTLSLQLISNEMLSGAKLSYEWITEASTGTATAIPMDFKGETIGGFSYQGSFKPEELGQYRIRILAKDLAGNEAVLPAEGVGYTVTVVIRDTKNAPVLTCLDESITSVDEGQELNIPYSYEDDMGIQKITIYYKTSSATDYQSIETTSFRIAGKYFAKIPADKLLNQEYVDYYLEGTNLYRSTKTPVKRIKINKIDDFTGIRTNLKEGDSLSGNVLITAKAKSDKETVSIKIDNTKMKQVNLLEKGAFFTFSFSGNDSYFKNAVSIGDNVLTYLAKWSNVMSSKAVFVDQSYFTYREDGSGVITVSLWAGTQGSAFEIGNANNNDDYKATGFQLVLTDGTILNPDNGIDPDTVYKMGDSKGMIERLDIEFTVPADKVDALGYVWDTTMEKDGLHEITVTTVNEIKKIQVRVDNTAPQIATEIKTNVMLNNLCCADFNFTDDTGVNESSLEVYLNGRILKAPYSFKGAELREGNNKLVVKIMDLNDNQGIQTVDFTYLNGKIVVNSMTQTGGKKDSIRLKALLGDSVMDNTEVTFNEGRRLIPGKEISIWQGSGDSTGSRMPGALGTVVSEDGEYPYQVYEIQAEGDPADILQVKISAEASYNKPVQLYVYKVSNNSWELLTTNEEDGIKKTEFVLGDHVQNGVAKVLVQARGTETTPSAGINSKGTIKNGYRWEGTGIPEQYDFSFAWITDTQYYTESWPETFTTMNQWIVSEKDKQKIKYAIHTGDLVDEFEQDYQWQCADKNMKYFEAASLPYGVLAGNHDVAAGNELYENYVKYFGENRFKDSPVYGGSYKNNLGHYDLLTVDGVELIVVYMGWDIYKNEIAWMDKVLKQYSDRKAILCFHRYITEAGALDYTGNLVQKEVVAKNPNVFAVLNGHYHGAAINITAFDDNYDGVKERTVYQICTDYQSAVKGGAGYVKMLYFDLANSKIYINSYSDELKDYNYFDSGKLNAYEDGVVAVKQDIYELKVNFERSPKSLTTTSLEAALFTGKTIGTVKSINKTAEIEWKGLFKDALYGWYTVMENSAGLLIRSDVSEFVFLPSEEPEPTPTPEPTKIPEPTQNPEPTRMPGAADSSRTGPVIAKVNPEYTIPTGLTAVYGDTLADIILPEGFTFKDKLTMSVGDAGLHTFYLNYTPKDTSKYNIVTDIKVYITVNKAEQKFVTSAKTSYTKTYGDNAFSIKAKTNGNKVIKYLSDNTKAVIVSKNGTVTIKGCGSAVITLIAAETKNFNAKEKKIKIIVIPQQVTGLKIKSTAPGTFTLAWETNKDITGYEITYAADKKFTKDKKTVMIKNSKIVSKSIQVQKKNSIYYVRTRAYIIAGKEKIYSTYGTVKKMKL
jgi:hypothetical protein